jgi:hypothetical protein
MFLKLADLGHARERNIPIVMVLSGSYTKKSAGIIGKSVHNIVKNSVYVG